MENTECISQQYSWKTLKSKKNFVKILAPLRTNGLAKKLTCTKQRGTKFQAHRPPRFFKLQRGAHGFDKREVNTIVPFLPKTIHVSSNKTKLKLSKQQQRVYFAKSCVLKLKYSGDKKKRKFEKNDENYPNWCVLCVQTKHGIANRLWHEEHFLEHPRT